MRSCLRPVKATLRNVTTNSRNINTCLSTSILRNINSTTSINTKPLASSVYVKSANFFATDSTPDRKAETVEDLQAWSKLNQEGMSYLRNGTAQDLNEAERCFREAANIMSAYPMMPYRSLSLANLASCLVRKGRFNDAINMFRPLLLELPMFTQVSTSQIATVHMELANAYEFIGDLQGASKELNIASSRFVSSANSLLKQVQSLSQDATNYVEQKEHLISLMVNSWKSALGCRFSSAVLLHKLGEWEASHAQLLKILVVYKYMVQCIETIIEHYDQPYHVIEQHFLETPPEAQVVTAPLVPYLATMPVDFLKQLTTSSIADITSILQSVAAISMDLQNIEGACEAYVEACKLTLYGNIDNFMSVIGDACKSLRLLYEKLQYENATSDFDSEGKRIRSSNNDAAASELNENEDPRVVVFKRTDRNTLIHGMKVIDSNRAIMRQLIKAYSEERLRLQPKAPEPNYDLLPPDLKQYLDASIPLMMDQIQADIDAGLFNPETGEDKVPKELLQQRAEQFNQEYEKFKASIKK